MLFEGVNKGLFTLACKVTSREEPFSPYAKPVMADFSELLVITNRSLQHACHRFTTIALSLKDQGRK